MNHDTNPDTEEANSPTPIQPVATPRQTLTPGEIFLRLLILLAGIFLGAILALIIGLFAGWIEIGC